MTAKPSFREQLIAPDGFLTIAELVPWAGPLQDERGCRELSCARELAGHPRIAALSITDNAGGHAMVSPTTLAEEFVARGQDVIVHVACRDRSRIALQSLGWELASRGLTNVLALSGDYPVEGYAGLSRPVFDLDSVALLQMYRALGVEALPPDGFLLGCAVNNHKRLEREVIPQYLKLAMKARTGAGFVISQVGYDARKQDELLKVMQAMGAAIPAIANVYILSKTVARIFNEGKIPGCVVTDELRAIAEAQAVSPDKGRAFFLELAAKQVAIARGLGYRGVYLSGFRAAAEVERILGLADGFGPDDWRDLAREIQFGQPGEFYQLERDATTGLASETLSRRYRRSRTTGARRRARLRVPLAYRFDRLVHDLAFMEGTAGFRFGTAFYERAERLRLARPLHAAEQVAKLPLFDCRDCGDCSLPEIAYLCPESQCMKNQRNGPCGGSHDGICETGDRECIWARAYTRLKPYGEELTMLDRAPTLTDNALRRTSAWANTYLGRDHVGRQKESH